MIAWAALGVALLALFCAIVAAREAADLREWAAETHGRLEAIEARLENNHKAMVRHGCDISELRSSIRHTGETIDRIRLDVGMVRTKGGPRPEVRNVERMEEPGSH